MAHLIERQVITTWYKPEEKLPEDGVYVVATISGKTGNITFDHAMVMADYYEGDGWCIDDYDFTLKGAWLKVHAWADLEPYGEAER